MPCLKSKCNFVNYINYIPVREEQESGLHEYAYFAEIKWINIYHPSRHTVYVKLNG